MTKNNKKNDNTVNLVLAVSVALAAYFLYHLLQLLQNVKINSIVGSPASYAAFPSAALAIFVLMKATTNKQRYISIIVLTVLVTGFLVWLFGATGAGSNLVTRISI